jgi:hypothetical protein
VPQGSVLGPLLFLIYINDISDGAITSPYLFADDTSLFCPVYNGDMGKAAHTIQSDLNIIEDWADRWLVKINPTKTVMMLFSRKRYPSAPETVRLGGCAIPIVHSHKHLGLLFNSILSWSEHIDSQVSRCNRLIGMLQKFKYRWSRKALETCYLSFIRPVIEYCDIIYDGCTIAKGKTLENVQLEAARLVLGAKRGTSHEAIYLELGWQTLANRRYCHKMVKMYSIVNKLAPNYLIEIFNTYIMDGENRTRAQQNKCFKIPLCKRMHHKNSFVVSGIIAWNRLDLKLKTLTSLSSFKLKLNDHTSKIKLPFYEKTSRKTQVSFTQLRVGFSNLNYDLFLKGCVTESKCVCGAEKEDLDHFFSHCYLYDDIRKVMFADILSVSRNVSLKPAALFKGSEFLNNAENMLILCYVCKFIEQSKRF